MFLHVLGCPTNLALLGVQWDLLRVGTKQKPGWKKKSTSFYTVRPPPGFECKSLSGQVPVIDDPSILWSKTVEAGQYLLLGLTEIPMLRYSLLFDNNMLSQPTLIVSALDSEVVATCKTLNSHSALPTLMYRWLTGNLMQGGCNPVMDCHPTKCGGEILLIARCFGNCVSPIL